MESRTNEIRPTITFVVVLICLLLVGCGDPSTKLVGGYSLVQFNEGVTKYYVKAPGRDLGFGGIFDGIIKELGFSDKWILARVEKCYQGDTNGWYAVNVQTKQMVGPIEESNLKTNIQFIGIKTDEPSNLFYGHK